MGLFAISKVKNYEKCKKFKIELVKARFYLLGN